MQKKSISMKNSQFFDYLLYAKSKSTFNKILIKKSLLRNSRWKSGVGKMNAITNRLHNSLKIKDNSLTGRNYERYKKYVP